MTNEIVLIEFPLSALSDNELTGLYSYLGLYAEAAPTFVGCLRAGLVQEATRRQDNRDGKPHQNACEGFAVNFGQFSDRDVGDAMALTFIVSENAQTPFLREFIAEADTAITAIACQRLRNSNDPRNLQSFEERQHGNPEAN